MRPDGHLSTTRSGDSTLVVRLAGSWRLEADLPPIAPVEREIRNPTTRALALDTRELGSWDSALVALVVSLGELCRARAVLSPHPTVRALLLCERPAWNAQNWDVFRKRHSADTAVYWPGQPEPTRGRDAHQAESETVGLLRQTRHRGRDRVGWMFTFAVAVYNLVRLRTLRGRRMRSRGAPWLQSAGCRRRGLGDTYPD